MLRPGERVSPNVSELSRLMKKLFDGAAQLGHDRIMHDPFSDNVGAPLRREASAPTPCRAPLQVPYRGVHTAKIASAGAAASCEGPAPSQHQPPFLLSPNPPGTRWKLVTACTTSASDA